MQISAMLGIVSGVGVCCFVDMKRYCLCSGYSLSNDSVWLHFMLALFSQYSEDCRRGYTDMTLSYYHFFVVLKYFIKSGIESAMIIFIVLYPPMHCCQYS